MNEEHFETYATRTYEIKKKIFKIFEKNNVNLEEAFCISLTILTEVLHEFEFPEEIIKCLPSALDKMLKIRENT